MNIILKDSHKIDVFKFDLEQDGNVINMTINNAISWDWMQFKFTKEELKSLSDFITKFLEN
jgi:hypothetical protein